MAGEAQWGHDGPQDGDFDDRAAFRVAPAAGTPAMFGGGWRWHRVDPA